MLSISLRKNEFKMRFTELKLSVSLFYLMKLLSERKVEKLRMLSFLFDRKSQQRSAQLPQQRSAQP